MFFFNIRRPLFFIKMLSFLIINSLFFAQDSYALDLPVNSEESAINCRITEEQFNEHMDNLPELIKKFEQQVKIGQMSPYVFMRKHLDALIFAIAGSFFGGEIMRRPLASAICKCFSIDEDRAFLYGDFHKIERIREIAGLGSTLFSAGILSYILYYVYLKYPCFKEKETLELVGKIQEFRRRSTSAKDRSVLIEEFERCLDCWQNTNYDDLRKHVGALSFAAFIGIFIAGYASEDLFRLVGQGNAEVFAKLLIGIGLISSGVVYLTLYHLVLKKSPEDNEALLKLIKEIPELKKLINYIEEE